MYSVNRKQTDTRKGIKKHERKENDDFSSYVYLINQSQHCLSHTDLAYCGPVVSYHWLDAVMSSSLIRPSSMPKA